jgi:hypothetical protein
LLPKTPRRRSHAAPLIWPLPARRDALFFLLRSALHLKPPDSACCIRTSQRLRAPSHETRKRSMTSAARSRGPDCSHAAIRPCLRTVALVLSALQSRQVTAALPALVRGCLRLDASSSRTQALHLSISDRWHCMSCDADVRTNRACRHPVCSACSWRRCGGLQRLSRFFTSTVTSGACSRTSDSVQPLWPCASVADGRRLDARPMDAQLNACQTARRSHWGELGLLPKLSRGGAAETRNERRSGRASAAHYLRRGEHALCRAYFSPWQSLAPSSRPKLLADWLSRP